MARPRQVSDEQILARTRQCVLQFGPAVSLDVVAKELGVSSPALLRRFGTRRALLVAALRPPDRPHWVSHLEQGPDDRPFLLQLEDAFQQMSDFFSDMMPCMSALRESGIPHEEIFPKGKTPAPINGLQAILHWLKAARAKRLFKADHIESCAYAMLGSLQSRMFISHLLNRSWSKKEQRAYVHELVSLFSRALDVREVATKTLSPQKGQITRGKT